MKLEESLAKFIQGFIAQAGPYAKNYAAGVNPTSPDKIDFLHFESEGAEPEYLFSVSHEMSKDAGFYAIYYQNQIILARFLNIIKFDANKTIRFTDKDKIIFELEYAES